MLPAPLNFNRLRLFAAVVERGSVTAAAAALGISQPAVTKAVHELERDCGLPLLEHIGRGVRPTAAGTTLAGYAIRIFALSAEAVGALAEERGLMGGHLAIGASTTVGIYLLPELLGRFRAKYPAITLALDIANTEEIVARLRDYRADLTLVEGPVAADDLIVRPYRADTLVLIVAPAHPLARGGTMATVDDLAGLPWLMREPGSGTREVAEGALRSAGLAPQIALELGSTEAIKGAVAAGFGASLVSQLTIAQELALGRLAMVPTALDPVRRILSIIERRAARPSPAAVAFLDLLQTRPS